MSNEDKSEESIDELSLAQASSTYKVRGKLSDDTGAGVLGKNTSKSGTPIGVEGAVPNASGGYGLSTPHDANISGTAELGGLAGSVTGNTEITDLLGESLTIDGSNTLQVTSTYKTNTFDAGGLNWDVVTGLSSSTPVEITVDTNGMNAGRIVVDVDGTSTITMSLNEVRNRIIGASSSVTLKSEVDFGLDTRFTPDELTPVGITFKGDGTKMYIVDDGFDTVYEYGLSTPWDVSTASKTGATLDASSEDTTLRGLAVKDDGAKIYLTGQDNGNVYSYSLSTPWDLSTASYLREYTDTASITDVAFSTDGSKMFETNSSNSYIYAHDLNGDWDLGTVQSANPFSFSEPSPMTGLGFNSDGTELYVTDDGGKYVYWYGLSSAWDLSSKSFLKKTDVSGDVDEANDIFIKDDSSMAFIVDQLLVYFHQFSKKFDGAAYASVEKERS